VGWSEAKKGPGSDFFDIFFMVFLNSPHRETPKNVIKNNQENIGFGFLVECFVKTFDFWSKKSRLVGGWVWNVANVRGGSVGFVLAAPRAMACLVWRDSTSLVRWEAISSSPYMMHGVCTAWLETGDMRLWA
jgi:hypothetical protein